MSYDPRTVNPRRSELQAHPERRTTGGLFATLVAIPAAIALLTVSVVVLAAVLGALVASAAIRGVELVGRLAGERRTPAGSAVEPGVQ